MKIFDEFIDLYNEYIIYGKEFLLNKNICITGLIKNGADHIDDKLNLFRLIRSHCASLSVLIYENDSIDDTVHKIKSWQDTDIQFHIISETLNATHRGHPYKDIERTTAMASYRNKCLDYIRKKIKSDYIIVLDLDYKQMSMDGLLNSFGWMSKKSQIDIMAGFSYQQHANGLLTNYDSWAYRGNWWRDYQSDKNFAYTFINWVPFIGSEPFKVNSAFGGCCIYKNNIYLQGKYTGEDCEHVTFHRSIYNKNTQQYKLYVNPSQIMIV